MFHRAAGAAAHADKRKRPTRAHGADEKAMQRALAQAGHNPTEDIRPSGDVQSIQRQVAAADDRRRQQIMARQEAERHTKEVEEELHPHQEGCTKENVVHALLAGSIEASTNKKLAWDAFVCAIILYSVIVVPFRIGFSVDADGTWLIVDYCVDGFFFLDIIVNFVTQFTDEEGLVVADRWKIASHYARGWLIIDFLSTIPVDLLVAIFKLDSSGFLFSFKMLRILRLARLLKLVRLMKLGRLIDNMEELQDMLTLNPAIVRLLKLLAQIMFMGHLLSCFWFWVASLDPSEKSFVCKLRLHAECPQADTWAELGGMQNQWSQYLIAMYWTMATMTTVGYGDIYAETPGEKAYAIVTMLIGASVFGFIIGNISSLLGSMDARRAAYKHKLDEVKEYLRDRRFPKGLGGRLVKYFEYYMDRRSIFDEQTILAELSNSLRTQVVMKANHDAVRRIHFLRNEDRGFVTTVMTHVKPLFVVAGECLCVEGDVGAELYFLMKGTMEALSKLDPKSNAETVVGVYTAGNTFGDVAVLTGSTRPYSLYAVVHCDTFSLSKEDLMNAVFHFPDTKASMDASVEARIQIINDAKMSMRRAAADLDKTRMAQTTSSLLATPAPPRSLSARLSQFRKGTKVGPSAARATASLRVTPDTVVEIVGEDSKSSVVPKALTLSDSKGSPPSIEILPVSAGVGESKASAGMEAPFAQSAHAQLESIAGADEIAGDLAKDMDKTMTQQLMGSLNFSSTDLPSGGISSLGRSMPVVPAGGMFAVAARSSAGDTAFRVGGVHVARDRDRRKSRRPSARPTLGEPSRFSAMLFGSVQDAAAAPPTSAIKAVANAGSGPADDGAAEAARKEADRLAAIARTPTLLVEPHIFVNDRLDMAVNVEESKLLPKTVDDLAQLINPSLPMEDMIQVDDTDLDTERGIFAVVAAIRSTLWPERKDRGKLVRAATQRDALASMTASGPAATNSVFQHRNAAAQSQRIKVPNVHELKPWHVVNPNAPQKLIWDIGVAVLIVYSVITIPFRIGFEVDASRAVTIVDYIVDVFFILDMIVNFRTAYQSRLDDTWVYDWKLIARNYLRNWFIIDLLSTVPVDWFLAAYAEDDGAAFRSLKLFRVLRLVRLLKLARLAKLNRFLVMLEDRYHVSPAALRLVKLFFEVMFIAHLMSSGFFFASVIDQDVALTWWQHAGVSKDKSVGEVYLTAIYFSYSTMTTVGYGDISAKNNPEMLYAIVCMILGATVFGYIVGSMASIVNRLNYGDSRYKEKMDEVAEYLRERNIDPELRKKVRKYYEYYLHRKSVFDEATILSELSVNLKREAVLHLNKDIINKIPFFEAQSEGFISFVMSIMQPMFCVPQDFVFQEGEIGLEMYFLVKGEVSVVQKVGTDEEVVLKTLGEGAFFGEIAILCATKRTAGIRAITYCNLFVLHKDDLDVMIMHYPTLAAMMQKSMRAKMKSMWADTAARVRFQRAAKKAKNLASLPFGKAKRSPTSAEHDGSPTASETGGSEDGVPDKVIAAAGESYFKEVKKRSRRGSVSDPTRGEGIEKFMREFHGQSGDVSIEASSSTVSAAGPQSRSEL